MTERIVDARLYLARLELQVALLARAGLKRWEIAMALGIQQGTVKSQLERVVAKLGSEWKDRSDIFWPELEKDVRQAVETLKNQQGTTDGNGGSDRGGPAGLVGVPETGEEIAATAIGRQRISFSSARRAIEGEFSPAEAAILHLQGLPSRAGGLYLRQARATQWQLLLLGENRVLYTSAAARFWLKPALASLCDQGYIRFFHSDTTDEPYRPWWLPYTTNGRARGTRAAYYKVGSVAAGEYARNFLEAWVTSELEDYVNCLHARMQQRWRALMRIARASGRPEPADPPGLAELLSAAREALTP